jgi:16S rRNA (guanine(966)-N(2))-methyltransferase RsmD
MTNRAKAALFSILGPNVRQSTFLDLFAGTGQVGIEALSRGGARAVFVELRNSPIHAIYDNLKVTDLEDRADVVRADVFKYLTQTPKPYDYIYIAPPQYRELWIQTLQLVDEEPGWLEDDGWAIVQINPQEFEPLELQNLVLFDQRTYGSVMLCFYAIPVEVEIDEDRDSLPNI